MESIRFMDRLRYVEDSLQSVDSLHCEEDTLR